MDGMDMPDLDPVLPEPDFFDAEDGLEGLGLALVGAPLDAGSALQQSLSPVASVLDCVAQAELKDSDELGEFKEFILGLEPSNNNDNAGASGNEKGTDPAEVDNDNEEGKDVSKECLPSIDNENSGEDLLSTEENKSQTDVDDKSTISSAGPNTPDSKPGSAVIRLSLPVVPKVSISAKPSTSKKLCTSPPRVLRGRLDTSSTTSKEKADNRSKRKLSHDDDYDPESEDEEKEDDDVAGELTKTRSGRQTRKTTRYGHDESDTDEDHRKPTRNSTIQNKRSSRRKIARYGIEDDSEEEIDSSCSKPDTSNKDFSDKRLFSPVSKKKRPNYWTNDDGITYFVDRKGNQTAMKRLTIRIERLSEAEIVQSTKMNLNISSSDETEPISEEDNDSPFLLEVCIDNFLSAEEAVKGGAKRIELCSALSEGGLTPSGGFLTLVKGKFENIPVFVMIRPRGGDFVYTPEEIEIMSRDIQHYKQMGADGFVFGVLTKDCQVDVEQCRLLKQMAFPLECTFHRAFDRVSLPFSALETIINLGFTRILTSGQAATANAGIPTIKRLVETAKGRITIMAGAGVNERNVGDIVRKTGVWEVHGSASKSIPSIMCAPGPSKTKKRGGNRQLFVKMGSADESSTKVTNSNVVAQIIQRGRKNVKN